jgi:hypothetical protein
LCCFVVFIVLSFIQTLLINPVKKVVEEGIRKDAEYIIELKWDPEIDCDIDLWVSDPQKTTVSFKTKNNGLMHLERDDLGFVNDTYTANNLTFKFKHNVEVVTIRGRLPGKYTINGHLYACRFNGRSYNVNEKTPKPIAALMTVTRLNPALVMLVEKEMVFNNIFEEKTAVTINFGVDGYVTKLETDYIKLITVTRGEAR